MEEVIICVALCLFMNGRVSRAYIPKIDERVPSRLKEDRERTIQPERVQFKCGPNVKAKVEYIEEKGQTQGRIRIIEVLKHGYDSDNYDSICYTERRRWQFGLLRKGTLLLKL